ncbi:type II toxin-antitoxin system RelE/ParE family toxin [Patescibacteria group bacterium]|nr:type II toxin-antitoxin system RelE/ParE family toxin [Patescibacteria group bacterium]
MKITETAQFRKSYEKLETALKKKAQKQFKLFLANLFHASLNTEKLEPKESNVWSFRIDKGTRVIFTFAEKETVLLLDVGSHDIYRKKMR